MRRHRFEPYDLTVTRSHTGQFTMEFSVETKPNQTHTRVCLTLDRHWSAVIVSRIMEVVRLEEAAIQNLRNEIKSEADR